MICSLSILYTSFSSLMMLYTNVFPYRIAKKKCGITACRVH